MKKSNFLYALLLTVGFSIQAPVSVFSQMLNTPNQNMYPPKKMSNANIEESYRQKIQSLISSKPTFLYLSYFVNFKITENEKQGQQYTEEFKAAVIKTVADNYSDVLYKYYLSTFGTMFSEEEFDGISKFLHTEAGTRYAVSVVAVLLHNSPTLAPISKKELKKIDKYLVTFTGEKFKAYYPSILQQIQKPLVEYINKWIEVTLNDFNLAGKNQFKPLDAQENQ